MDALLAYVDEGPPRRLHVGGEIDLATVDEFREALHGAVADEQITVVEMTEVTFIDASGLRAILQAAESLNGRGPLILVNAPIVERLLKFVAPSPYVEFRVDD